MLRKFLILQMHLPAHLKFGRLLASPLPLVSMAHNLNSTTATLPRRTFTAKLEADEQETHSDFKSESKTFDTKEV